MIRIGEVYHGITTLSINCDVCQDILGTMTFGDYNFDKEFKILCSKCYKERSKQELEKIAKLSSDMVLKELGKLG